MSNKDKNKQNNDKKTTAVTLSQTVLNWVLVVSALFGFFFIDRVNNRLANTQAELAITQKDLAGAQTELAITQTGLAELESEVKKVNISLDASQLLADLKPKVICYNPQDREKGFFVVRDEKRAKKLFMRCKLENYGKHTVLLKTPPIVLFSYENGLASNNPTAVLIPDEDYTVQFPPSGEIIAGDNVDVDLIVTFKKRLSRPLYCYVTFNLQTEPLLAGMVFRMLGIEMEDSLPIPSRGPKELIQTKIKVWHLLK